MHEEPRSSHERGLRACTLSQGTDQSDSVVDPRAPFEGYRLNLATKLSLVGLLAANVLPLFGLLVLGWPGFSVVLAYVLETIVVGIYTALRIWLVAKHRGENAAMVFFFGAHYGLFVGVQAIFVAIGAGDAGELRGGLELTGLLVMVGGFVLSHGQSFFVHFLRGKGYERTTQSQEMARPYVRIFVQQFAVIGGFWLMGVGTLGPALVILGLKTVIDVIRHVSEHRKEVQGAPA